MKIAKIGVWFSAFFCFSLVLIPREVLLKQDFDRPTTKFSLDAPYSPAQKFLLAIDPAVCSIKSKTFYLYHTIIPLRVDALIVGDSWGLKCPSELVAPDTYKLTKCATTSAELIKMIEAAPKIKTKKVVIISIMDYFDAAINKEEVDLSVGIIQAKKQVRELAEICSKKFNAEVIAYDPSVMEALLSNSENLVNPETSLGQIHINAEAYKTLLQSEPLYRIPPGGSDSSNLSL